MKNPIFQALTFCAISAATLLGASAFAADENINVTPTQQVTKQELAAIYVLSEICPSMVKDKSQFNQGYTKLVTEYMPGQRNPVESLNQMAKQNDFRNILAEAQSDAKKAGKKKNQVICNELTTYNN
ncbi:MCR_0457 family protein [Acinetobacter lwoffii]|uniref:MCR_0457 family protein n=1 Tax=Acinetobacter lwoffii TaxID=28090 RepID=UPI003F911700